MNEDERFMALAISEAEKAVAEGDKPFGAVVVHHGRAVAKGHNLAETRSDPTAHAEVLAIRKACSRLRALGLEDCTLYTTCEPCLMCAGAIFAARIRRVVIGAVWTDAPGRRFWPRPSFLDIVDRASYPVTFATGVLREECAGLYTFRPSTI